MSIQFRARIKSAADYTSHLSDNGVCCYPDGDQGESSYSSCMNAGGYFQYVQVLQGELPSEVVCPNLSDTGCCCACEYVDDYDEYLVNVEDNNLIPTYEGGLQDVSRCECDRIGGVWTPDACSTFIEGPWEEVFNLCTGGAYGFGTSNPVEHDRRFPEGCCVSHESGSDVDGGPWKECKHVCSSRECSEHQSAAWPECCPNEPDEDLCINCPHCCANHYPTISCGYDPTVPEEDQIMCGDERNRAYSSGGLAFNDDEFNNILVVSKQFTENRIESKYRNTMNNSPAGVASVCITAEDRVNYVCKIKSKQLCSGIWMGLNDAGLSYKCEDSEVNIIKDFLKDGTITKETLDGWELGEYHIAGQYAGIFNYGGEDGINVSVEGLGNPKTGPEQLYTIQSDSKDIKEFKSFVKSQYAILILPYNLEQNSSELHGKRQTIKNQSKSKFDSVRNMVTPLDKFNVVNSLSYNGIGGWVIPSQHTLAFIANQIQQPEFIKNITSTNNKAYRWYPMNKSYWSSTLLGDTLKMAYIHDFDKNFVGVSPLNGTKHWTRPIRLIKIK